jgi:hypothetical protein
MNDLVVFYVYAISAMVEMVILECVIRQVDYDWLNNRDKEWVRWARRSTFLAGQGYLLITIILAAYEIWQPNLIVAGLIWAGILILGVNVISLNHRKPPLKEDGYHRFTTFIPLKHLMTVFRKRIR